MISRRVFEILIHHKKVGVFEHHRSPPGCWHWCDAIRRNHGLDDGGETILES